MTDLRRDQSFSGGDCWTRTSDLLRVKETGFFFLALSGAIRCFLVRKISGFIVSASSGTVRYGLCCGGACGQKGRTSVFSHAAPAARISLRDHISCCDCNSVKRNCKSFYVRELIVPRCKVCTAVNNKRAWEWIGSLIGVSVKS